MKQQQISFSTIAERLGAATHTVIIQTKTTESYDASKKL